MILAEDGVCAEAKKGWAEIVGQVSYDYVYIDGTSIGELGEQELCDCRVLAEEGFAAVYVVMELTIDTILVGLTVIARGVVENAVAFRDIEPQIADALAEAVSGGRSTVCDMERVVRRILGRWAPKRLRRVPMIVPLVMEAE